jgi:hypothetical protein
MLKGKWATSGLSTFPFGEEQIATDDLLFINLVRSFERLIAEAVHEVSKEQQAGDTALAETGRVIGAHRTNGAIRRNYR